MQKPLMLGSQSRLLPIDSDFHRQNEECWHVPTKETRVNKFDDSLVDEVERVLLLVDFCRLIGVMSFSIVLSNI